MSNETLHAPAISRSARDMRLYPEDEYSKFLLKHEAVTPLSDEKQLTEPQQRLFYAYGRLQEFSQIGLQLICHGPTAPEKDIIEKLFTPKSIRALYEHNYYPHFMGKDLKVVLSEDPDAFSSLCSATLTPRTDISRNLARTFQNTRNQ